MHEPESQQQPPPSAEWYKGYIRIAEQLQRQLVTDRAQLERLEAREREGNLGLDEQESLNALRRKLESGEKDIEALLIKARDARQKHRVR